MWNFLFARLDPTICSDLNRERSFVFTVYSEKLVKFLFYLNKMKATNHRSSFLSCVKTLVKKRLLWFRNSQSGSDVSSKRFESQK